MQNERGTQFGARRKTPFPAAKAERSFREFDMQETWYAFWFADARDDFGFSNFYSCDSMLWDPDAIRCQQVYLDGLLSRRNAFSGRRLDEYPNLVVFELFNEPRYPEKWQLEKDCEITPANMGKRSFVSTYRKTNRGAKGVVNIKLREGEHVLSVIQMTDEDEILLTTERGQLVRIPAGEIRTVGRASKGVRIMGTAKPHGMPETSTTRRVGHDLFREGPLKSIRNPPQARPEVRGRRAATFWGGAPCRSGGRDGEGRSAPSDSHDKANRISFVIFIQVLEISLEIEYNIQWRNKNSYQKFGSLS